MSQPPRNRTGEEGQAAAELALVLPALCLILLAILQFGILFKDYLALTDAVRAGARTAAVSRHLSPPEPTVVQAVEDAATDLDGDLRVDVRSSWKPGAPVEVEAFYPYKISLLGLVVKEGDLTSETVERVE